MFENLIRLWWRAAQPLTRKIGTKPLGIWVVWASLAYATGMLLAASPCLCRCLSCMTPGGIITVLILAASAVSLASRRLIARAFCGMSLALLLRDAAAAGNILGVVLPPLAFICLLANRRWFYERLPNIG